MAKAVEGSTPSCRQPIAKIEEAIGSWIGTLKKCQMARVLATVLVIGLSSAPGSMFGSPSSPELHIVWRLFGFDSDRRSPRRSGQRLLHRDGRARAIRKTLSLLGRLAPWRSVTVTSPLESHIAALHFKPGQKVKKGDLLVELSTSDAARTHREVRAKYNDALKAYEAVRDWESGPEMAEARRSFARARMALESHETDLKRAEFLLEQGLIPASQHEEAERQYRGQILDFEAAQQDLAAARARGDPEELDKAAQELEAAQSELEEVAESISRSLVRAPISVCVDPFRAGGLAEDMKVGQGPFCFHWRLPARHGRGPPGSIRWIWCGWQSASPCQ